MYSYLLTLLKNSLVLSALIVALAGLTQLLGSKASPRVRSICWLVIAVGLLIPVRPALFTMTLTPEYPSIVTGFVERFENLVAPTEETEMSADPVAGVVIDNEGIVIDKNIYRQPKTAANSSSEQKMPIDHEIVLPAVWLIGVCVFMSSVAVRHIRFSRFLKRRSVRASDEHLLSLFEEVLREIKLKRTVRLFVSPLISTPVLVGLLRPSIILPNDVPDNGKLRFMMMHEALHCKHGDIWKKAVSVLAMATHWFNPLVYLMNRYIIIESERATDNAVLRLIGNEQRVSYGETILYSVRRGKQAVSAFSSSFNGGGKNLKKRLLAIVEGKTPKRWVAILCAVALLGGLILGGLVGCENLTSSGAVPIADAPVDLTPTDELVIYAPNVNYIIKDIELAVAAYKMMYNDVNVRLEKIGSADDYSGEEYISRINSELMAGTGPDIVLVHHYFFPDINKTMDTGSFLNLAEIVEQDEKFNPEDYYQPVLDAGLYKGGRYLVPYSFTFPFIFGLQEQLDTIGFDMAKNTDFISFFNELTDKLPQMQANPSFTAGLYWLYYINGALRESGLQIIDYENGKVLPDAEAFKAFCDAFKPYWQVDAQEWTKTTFSPLVEVSLQRGECLFYNNPLPVTDYIYSIADVKTDDTQWVLDAMRTMDGGINATMNGALAINATSKNQLNAWNFIKTMISKQVQLGGNQQGPSICLPVNRAAMTEIIGKAAATAQTIGYATYDGVGQKQVAAVTSTEKQIIYDLLDSMTECSFWNYNVLGYFLDSMTPYFNDEKSYNECVNDLKQKLTLYVSE